MKTNNLPDLKNLLVFNPQVLYDIILKLQIQIEVLENKVNSLESKPKT